MQSSLNNTIESLHHSVGKEIMLNSTDSVLPEKWKKEEWKAVVGGLHPIQPPMYIAPYEEQLQHLRIGSGWMAKLANLKNLNVDVILDDSGSMAHSLSAQNISLYISHQINRPDGKPIRTRFDELWHTIDVCSEIFAALNMNVAIHFLNHPASISLHGMKDLSQVRTMIGEVFQQGPGGPTPLLHHLRQVKRKLEQDVEIDDHFLLIFTDGEPSDGSVDEFKREIVARQGKQETKFFKLLKVSTNIRNQRQQKNHLTLVACTDQENEVAYMNSLDKLCHQTDIVDDWFSETTEIAQVHARLGLKFDFREQFTYGDHKAKILLGANDRIVNLMDEMTNKFTRK